jgi:hypothetical protein
VAKLWGVLEGLKIVWDRGFRKVGLHVNSNIVAKTPRSDNMGSVAWLDSSSSNLAYSCVRLGDRGYSHARPNAMCDNIGPPNSMGVLVPPNFDVQQ